MKDLERTQQQMDPALSLDSRVATLSLAGMALAWSVGLTILSIAATGAWEPRVWAVALLATATIVVARETAPLRAPFTAQAHLVVHVLACTAYLLYTNGSEGSAASRWLPWIPIALSLLIVAMCRYRPPREILGAGLLSTSAIALATMPLVAAPMPLHGAPGGALVLTAVLPVMTASVAAACYSRILVANSERWKAQAGYSSAALEPALLSDIERVMYRERVNALSGEAFPFLRRVLDADSISAADRDTARDIAARIRSAMVHEVDRTWLQAAVDSGPTGVHAPVVDDPDACAPMMSGTQRAALRTLISSLGASPRLDRFTISIRATDGTCRGEVWARFRAPYRPPRRRRNADLAVLRVAFSEVTVSTPADQLIVRFSFDHA
ncbi:hypothetical protein PA27867_0500 [Cryobacterium arcticum]|uniref:Uncharacterized protein n=2 Tax=Cryobacterium arcticum TaxID=670052 RepID=A0A1B1BFV8_9MICO|nr:hypothetical protein PA27867_0500 [Cryobacterium arcticum]